MEEREKWKIVLIDDEQDIREVVSLDLTDAGYQVFTAEDGATGISLVEEVSPQIVITDIRMPGIDGIQVLSNIKDKIPNTQIIVVTAFGEIDIAVRALQLDASDFITKPINPEALHMALKRARERYLAVISLAEYTHLLEQENAHTAAELNQAIAFQKNLTECSMDGILACDSVEMVMTCNRSLLRLLGYDRNEILQKKTLEQLFVDNNYQRFKAALMGEKYGGPGKLVLFETCLQDSSGEKTPVQVSATMLPESNRQGGVVCFFRDLRDVRRLEREMADQARILHQDKMMSLGRLAASVVHEINNPLSGILNYLRLMARIIERGPLSDDKQDKFKSYLELVEKETSRCSRIVANLLTFSRKSEPTFTPIQLEPLIEQCVNLSRHKLELSNIDLDVNLDASLPPVMADINQLQQCIINLIFNAIDAMDDGGTLSINVTADNREPLVTIAVKDTGKGIPPENLSRIFDPFFTTKQEGYGVGLGLSTVFGIMERHHGAVEVSSPPERGSEFRLKLPV